MTRPSYEQALADAGVTLDGLEAMGPLRPKAYAGPEGFIDSWELLAPCPIANYPNAVRTVAQEMSETDAVALAAARNALPILIAGIREETTRADKAELEHETTLRFHEEACAETKAERARADKAEAALAEAQRQAAEAERAGWIKGRDAAAAECDRRSDAAGDEVSKRWRQDGEFEDRHLEKEMDAAAETIRALAPPTPETRPKEADGH